MEYLKSFKNNADYKRYIISEKAKFPNVSLLRDLSIVKFLNNKPTATTGVKFTANAEQGLTMSFNGVNPNFEYSYDCNSWVSLTPSVTATFGTTEHPCVYVRGNNPNGISQDSSVYASFVFTNSTAKVDVDGNVMDFIDYNQHSTTIPNDFCFCKLFENCSSLQTVSSTFLPATALTDFCYYCMFNGCTSLVNISSLPASTLAQYCYAAMFSGCTSLTSAPILPATTMETACYFCMFSGCISLSSAPVLPAATLKQLCYGYMFEDCALINEIHCDATDISENNCTKNWTIGISSTGNFYGKTAASWPDGNSGIPNGWTKHLS